MDNRNNKQEEDAFNESMREEERFRAAAVQADLAGREREAAEEDLRAARRARRQAQIERDRARRINGQRRRDRENAEVESDSGNREERRRIDREESRRAEREELRQSDQEELREMDPEERRAFEDDYEDYRTERQSSIRRPDRSGRRNGSSNDDTEFLENNPRRKKKAGPFRVFLRTLLIILIVMGLLLGYLYMRIHGGIDFLKGTEGNSETRTADGYTNIALFGVDSVSESLSSGNNRSDVNIILSINDRTKECKMVSLYRDTYLDIGDATYTKCNAAYAYGGASQAVAMLNMNFDLDIEDYVTIGFGGISDIIDSVGGIEIDVQQEEISFMNDYQSTMAAELGKTYVPVTTAGTQTLNGLQATAYCRIRYTDGGDYHRTERQREVLTKTFAKLKSAGVATDAEIVMKLIADDELETSLSPTEMASLATMASDFAVSDTTGVPTSDLRVEAYVGDQACIIPYTLKANVVWMHQYLFGESDYQVSETVQEISNQIEQNTGY